MTIRILDARASGLDAIVRRLERPPSAVAPAIRDAVDDIVESVRRDGDRAVLAYTARFDGFEAETATALRIAAGDFERAEAALAPAARAALHYAAERIERFHAAAVPKSWRMTDEHGSILGQEVRPLDRVGIYIPGGRAAYPSTVLMTAMPARVAGVREIVLVTPPNADGAAKPSSFAVYSSTAASPRTRTAARISSTVAEMSAGMRDGGRSSARTTASTPTARASSVRIIATPPRARSCRRAAASPRRARSSSRRD